MFATMRKAYQASLKPTDSIFNLYLARPLATPLVLIAERLGLSPNHLTFMGLFSMTLASISWVMPVVLQNVGTAGNSSLWLGLFWLEFAYLLDCADGQLARRTGKSSGLGAELDFLMDELKAYLLIGALSLAWWHRAQALEALIWGVVTLVALASAIASTRFMRSEIVQNTGKVKLESHGDSAKTRQRKDMAKWVLMPARFLTQYPQSLPLFIFFDRLDLFVIAYGTLHAAYAIGRIAQAFLRFSRS